MRTRKTSRPYIYRAIDRKQKIDGYLAKVVRRQARLQKLFQLSKFNNSHRNSLRAAAAAVEAFVKKHPKMTRLERATAVRQKRDDDLPVGIRRVRNKVKGKFYNFYEASWSPEPNRQAKKRFSVLLYGDRAARKLAVLARKRGLAAMKKV
jgi:hypothetical protein